MPFTPTDKTPGDPLRSQDWNDHVHETLRLEAAKVNRSGDTITGPLTINSALMAVGNVGIGTANPQARLTIQQGSTDTISVAPNRPLFISGNLPTGRDDSGGGIEFRHDNLTQGIGFGFNTIYATGSNPNQELALQSRGTSPLLLNPNSGNVGINRTNGLFPLHFPNTLGDKITLWGDDATAHYGFGIQGGTLQIHTGGAGDKVSFGWGGSSTFHESMRIHGDGTLVVIGDAYLRNGGLRVPGTDPGLPAMRMICGGNYDTPMGCSISRPLGGGNGYYRINFNQAFNMRPFGSVTQVYPFQGTSGGDTRDNAVIVNITGSYIDLVTGDSGGNKGDRYFSFVFMGW